MQLFYSSVIAGNEIILDEMTRNMPSGSCVWGLGTKFRVGWQWWFYTAEILWQTRNGADSASLNFRKSSGSGILICT